MAHERESSSPETSLIDYPISKDMQIRPILNMLIAYYVYMHIYVYDKNVCNNNNRRKACHELDGAQEELDRQRNCENNINIVPMYEIFKKI